MGIEGCGNPNREPNIILDDNHQASRVEPGVKDSDDHRVDLVKRATLQCAEAMVRNVSKSLLNRASEEEQASIARGIADHTTEEILSYHLKPRPVKEQAAVLKELLGFNTTEVERRAVHLPDKPPARIPGDWDGWLVIPKWRSLGQDYPSALKKMLDLANEQFKLDWIVNSGDNSTDFLASQVVRNQRTEKMMDYLSKTWEGNLMVAPGQLGPKRVGQGAPKSEAAYGSAELGLGLVELLAVLLTHPRRLEPKTPGSILECYDQIVNNQSKYDLWLASADTIEITDQVLIFIYDQSRVVMTVSKRTNRVQWSRLGTPTINCAY